MANFSILINSTDKYSDCWIPLFTLLKKYWNPRNTNIYLNCENLNFEFPELNIKTIHNKPEWTWSQCLLNAIDTITDDIILYIQDDYFINKQVRVDEIDSFVELMYNYNAIKHIGLTTFGATESEKVFEHDNRLKIVTQNAKYRISLQAGLWNKECLKSYIEEDENAWMLEIFGSARARKKSDLFLTVSKNYYLPNPIIKYIHTGIIKGKWHKDIPDFFEKENIVVDFSKRGLIDPYKNRLINKFRTYRKILSKPKKIKYFLQ